MDELIKNSSGLTDPSAGASSDSPRSSASIVLGIFKMLGPDFNKVKVSTGGSTAFTLQTSEGTTMVPTHWRSSARPAQQRTFLRRLHRWRYAA